MGFLLTKILFLLVLAAASGALLAYWWFRRHYEDVTLDYARSREEWRPGAGVSRSAWPHARRSILSRSRSSSAPCTRP